MTLADINDCLRVCPQLSFPSWKRKKKKKNKNRNSDGMEDLLIKGRRLKQTYKGRQVIIWLNLILVATLKALVDTKVYFYYKIYIGKSIYIYSLQYNHKANEYVTTSQVKAWDIASLSETPVPHCKFLLDHTSFSNIDNHFPGF